MIEEVVVPKDDEMDYYIFTKKEIEQYDMEKTKDNVDDLISTYKQSKFSYFASSKSLENITSCYTPKYSQHCISSNDKVGNNVATKIDSDNFIKYFEEIMHPLLKDLSPRERKYYSYCLVNETSERTLSDLLSISRSSLLPIKNNCVLKIALAFKIAIMKSSTSL